MRNVAFLSLILAACVAGPTTDDPTTDDGKADGTGTTGPSAEEAQACAAGTIGKNAAGDTVLLCSQTFADAPYVHLPADDIAADHVTAYVGASLPTTGDGQLQLWTRTGTRYLPVDASGKPLQFASSKYPKSLHAPTNRVTFTLYQVTGIPGATVDTSLGPATATALQLISVRPVVQIQGCAFDSRLLGTWSGSVSARISPAPTGQFAKYFDEATRVPLHITLDTLVKAVPLADYKMANRIADADTYYINGTIDNFDKDVTIDGTTYPSLQAMGATNPFLGATSGAVQLYRLGNMHGTPGDAHWVLTYPAGAQNLTFNGMSYMLNAFTAPEMLLDSPDADTTKLLTQVTIKPHIPYLTNGNSVILAPEHIGAQAGQCGN